MGVGCEKITGQMVYCTDLSYDNDDCNSSEAFRIKYLEAQVEEFWKADRFPFAFWLLCPVSQCRAREQFRNVGLESNRFDWFVSAWSEPNLSPIYRMIDLEKSATGGLVAFHSFTGNSEDSQVFFFAMVISSRSLCKSWCKGFANY
ncbi:hypothetical protein ACMFMG_005215 [Clarireedia jacksonii]